MKTIIGIVLLYSFQTMAMELYPLNLRSTDSVKEKEREIVLCSFAFKCDLDPALQFMEKNDSECPKCRSRIKYPNQRKAFDLKHAHQHLMDCLRISDKMFKEDAVRAMKNADYGTAFFYIAATGKCPLCFNAISINMNTLKKTKPAHCGIEEICPHLIQCARLKNLLSATN